MALGYRAPVLGLSRAVLAPDIVRPHTRAWAQPEVVMKGERINAAMKPERIEVINVEFQVGEQFTVLWSNGGGRTVYKIVDNPGSGRHLLEVVEEEEFGGMGMKYPKGFLAHDPTDIYSRPEAETRTPTPEVSFGG